MGAIDPRVTSLVHDLFIEWVAHLTPAHQRDYLHSKARAIQVDIDQWFSRTPPLDSDWPTWNQPQNAAARKASQALTESGNSVAHMGTVGSGLSNGAAVDPVGSDGQEGSTRATSSLFPDLGDAS